MNQNLNRREFLRTATGVAVGVAAGLPGGIAIAADNSRGVAIIVDPADAVASSAPATWAAGELAKALTQRGVSARILPRASEATAGDLKIFAAGLASNVATAALKSAGVRADAVPESL